MAPCKGHRQEPLPSYVFVRDCEAVRAMSGAPPPLPPPPPLTFWCLAEASLFGRVIFYPPTSATGGGRARRCSFWEPPRPTTLKSKDHEGSHTLKATSRRGAPRVDKPQLAACSWVKNAQRILMPYAKSRAIALNSASAEVMDPNGPLPLPHVNLAEP